MGRASGAGGEIATDCHLPEPGSIVFKLVAGGKEPATGNSKVIALMIVMRIYYRI